MASPQRIRIMQLGETVATRIDEINEALCIIEKQIKRIQPKEHGSVLLYLHKCGKEECLGCPHPRWRKYVLNRKLKKGWALVDVNQKSPQINLRRSGNFAPCYDELFSLFMMACELEKERSHYAKYISNLSRAIKLKLNNIE